METELINYEKITRHIWQNLYKKTLPTLTEAELNNIKSINDEISVQDVNDVYLPLVQLIRIYKKTMNDLSFSKGLFLQKIADSQPFIISQVPLPLANQRQHVCYSSFYHGLLNHQLWDL